MHCGVMLAHYKPTPSTPLFPGILQNLQAIKRLLDKLHDCTTVS